MITPIAPAFWAFLALTTNPQVPRCTSAMLPATAAALVNALQPSFAVPAGASGTAGSTGSIAATMLPWKFAVVAGAPNAAVANSYSPTSEAGAVSASSVAGPSTAGAPAVTFCPTQTSWPLRVAAATISAGVIVSQILPVTLSRVNAM